MPCLPARFLFPSMMLADRFLGAWLGWLPWALVAPHGSPQGRGQLLSPLPACQMDGGQVFLPLPSGCLELHCDHSLLWGAGASSSSGSFLHVCFKPWKPPGSGLVLTTRSQVPLVALQLSVSLLARQCCGSSVTPAWPRGWCSSPMAAPHTPILEPWQDMSLGKGGWICLFLLPGTWLCPPRGPAVCPSCPAPACPLKRGCGQWWGTVGQSPASCQLLFTGSKLAGRGASHG